MIELNEFRLILPSPDVPKQYMVKWTGNPQKLFLVIKSTKPVLTINVMERTVVLASQPFVTNVSIPQTKTPIPLPLPQLPISTFSFELYDNAEGRGSCIAKEDAFIGQKILFKKRQMPYQDGFVRVILFCDYIIPEDLFWLKLDNRYLSMRFPMPKMQPCEGGGFQTACLLKSDAYPLISIDFDDRVKELFATKQTDMRCDI